MNLINERQKMEKICYYKKIDDIWNIYAIDSFEFDAKEYLHRKSNNQKVDLLNSIIKNQKDILENFIRYEHSMQFCKMRNRWTADILFKKNILGLIIEIFNSDNFYEDIYKNISNNFKHLIYFYLLRSNNVSLDILKDNVKLFNLWKDNKKLLHWYCERSRLHKSLSENNLIFLIENTSKEEFYSSRETTHGISGLLNNVKLLKLAIIDYKVNLNYRDVYFGATILSILIERWTERDEYKTIEYKNIIMYLLSQNIGYDFHLHGSARCYNNIEYGVFNYIKEYFYPGIIKYMQLILGEYRIPYELCHIIIDILYNVCI